MQNIFIELLPPWVETGLQPAFYDKESGTVLQQVSRMYAKINQLIGSVNNQNKTIADYIQKFVDLKDYVDTYFTNLDVQSEINNKLDQMSEKGQLADIIAQYLQAQAVFGFNTIAEMSASENLANGAICKVLGKTNYQAGDGAFYKIRTITPDDVIDGVNIVKITHDNTLIGEIIPDYQLNNIANNLTNRVTNNENTLSLLTDKKYLFIGDSYGTGQNELQEQTTPWTTLVPQYMGLTNEVNSWTNSHNGSGFVNGYTFIAQLQYMAEVVPTDEITDIIIVGGYNDKSKEDSVIENKISELMTYAKTTYPNAKVKFGCVGWSRDYAVRQEIIGKLPVYQRITKYGGEYLNNTEWILHDYSLFGDDHYHPNQNGQNELSKYLVEAIKTGSCDVQRRQFSVNNIVKINESDTLNPAYCLMMQNNGQIDVCINLGFVQRSSSFTIKSETVVPICNISNNSLVTGSGVDCFTQPATVFIANTGGGSLKQINGCFSIIYDSSNHCGVLNYINDKTNVTTNDVNQFNTNVIHMTLPASYC